MSDYECRGALVCDHEISNMGTRFGYPVFGVEMEWSVGDGGVRWEVVTVAGEIQNCVSFALTQSDMPIDGPSYNAWALACQSYRNTIT